MSTSSLGRMRQEFHKREKTTGPGLKTDRLRDFVNHTLASRHGIVIPSVPPRAICPLPLIGHMSTDGKSTIIQLQAESRRPVVVWCS